MGVVLASGVGLAALRYATELWASAVFTATLLGLALAAAYASQRRGPRRAFWSAFVAFGAGYLVLAFGPWCDATIRPRLLPTKLLDAAFARLHPDADAAVRLWDVGTGRPVNEIRFSRDGSRLAWREGGAAFAGPSRDSFQETGHCLAAWLLALLGGFATRSFYERRDERRKEAVEKAAGVLLRVIEAGL